MENTQAYTMPKFETLQYQELVDIQVLGYNASLRAKNFFARELFFNISEAAREELESRNQ